MDPTYPSALPVIDNISLSVGNTAAEALSAFLSNVAQQIQTADPGDVTTNLEWLLNALQAGRLASLGAGEMGVGQLDAYLHTRTFGSKPGGYVWSIRSTGQALSPSLANILSRLNECQHAYDQLSDEIFSRRQKTFLDWNYHIGAIGYYVVQNQTSMDDDQSHNYLMDGMMNLLPLLLEAGAEGKITGSSGPYTYVPASFRIAVPPDVENFTRDFAGYTFNADINTAAADIATRLVDACFSLEGILPEGLTTLGSRIQTAIGFLKVCQTGGTDAQASLQQATTALQAALTTAQTLTDTWNKWLQPGGDLIDIKTNHIDAALNTLSAWNDPTTGLFSMLRVDPAGTIPVQAGDTYQGQMQEPDYDNAGAWSSDDGQSGFPGIKALLDQLTGQGNAQPCLFNTEPVAIRLATAYFWRTSGETATAVTPYYIQLAQQELQAAKAAAQTASTALGNAINASVQDTLVRATGSSLATLTATTSGILKLLTSDGADLAAIIARLQGLLTGGPMQTAGLSVAQLLVNMQSNNWKALIGDVSSALAQVLDRLPLALQVSIRSTYLKSVIAEDVQLANAPADPFWSPLEPVMLMAAMDDNSGLLKPVNRNGQAELLPCRLGNDLITGDGIALPDSVGSLASLVNSGISDLNTLIPQLTKEALLLWPEFNIGNSKLTGAWQENINAQEQATQGVVLAGAPEGLMGKLPYYTAYNRQTTGDNFQPLCVFWQTEYVHSSKVDFNSERLSADFLNGFTVDRYGADYQPAASSTNDFAQTATNSYSLSGVIPLSSASTANLLDEIRQYSKSKLGYDPVNGPPGGSGPLSAAEQVVYQTWSRYQSCNFLSQRLSGFNAGMIHRTQELQIPVNIPSSWLDHFGRESFWPSQFLFNQSAEWPTGWASEAIDYSAEDTSNQATYFTPLRAGFLGISKLLLVDTFGRFVTLPDPIVPIVSESLQSQTSVQLKNHPIYLPPRLIEPARILFRWSDPPVCGWLLPNHLDDSLMVYNSAGEPMGSLRNTAGVFRWFTVPGEVYQATEDNRKLMTDDLAAKNHDDSFASFFTTFLYPASADAGDNFAKFLDVIEGSRSFVISKSLQEDPALSVLIGQPLALVRATLNLELKGLEYTSLDHHTYPGWNAPGPTFQLDEKGFIPYDFDNFNDGGIKELLIPISLGAVDYKKQDQPIVFFDDGLVGFFIDDDYGTFYTPVETPDGYRIRSTYSAASQPLALTPRGDTMTVTMVMDPRTSVHASSSILPTGQITLPPDQYANVLNRIMVTFLTAPVLKGPGPLSIPLPAETGYDWSWWQVGAMADIPLKPAQINPGAFFTGGSQMIVDGWLKMKKDKSQ